MYHLKGSPVDPNRIYASQSSGWFGQIDPALQRRRARLGSRSATSLPTTARRHPHVVRRHAAPLGIQACLASRTIAHRSRHGLRRRGRRRACSARPTAARTGRSCPACARTAPARSGSRAPAGWACTRSCSIRTILSGFSSPFRPPACSARDDAGQTWRPINRGLKSQYIPDPNAEVGLCVHRIAMHPARPNVLFMQLHWDVNAQRRRGRVMARGERQLAD